MRFAVSLAVLLASCMGLQAADVTFNFVNLTNYPGRSMVVKLTPTNAPGLSSGGIVLRDPLKFSTDSTGALTVSNLAAMRYTVEATGPFAITPFQITVPDTNGAVYATNHFSVGIATSGTSSAYSIAASDARFLTKSNSGTTGYVATLTNGQWTALPPAASGQPASANLTNWSALDSATVFAQNNSLFVMKNGSDSTGTRGRLDKPFLTIAAANAVAQAGDTVFIQPGVWNENNITKPGVNYSCSGVTFTMAPASTVANSYLGIIDDRLGATTNHIWGKPNIIYHTGTNGVDLAAEAEASCAPAGSAPGSIGAIVITNALTRIYADIGNVQFGSVDNLNPVAAINIANCAYTLINVDEITDLFGAYIDSGFPTTNECSAIPGLPLNAPLFGSGIFWKLGETYINFTHIGVMPQYGIWPSQVGTNAANLYCTGDLLEQKIYQVGNNLNYVTWFNIKEIRGDSHLTTGVCFDIFGGKSYLYNQKVWSTSTGKFCANIQGDGRAWIYSNKFAAGGSGAFVTDGTGGGKMYLNVQEYEDTGALANGFSISHANADIFVNGGRMTITNGVGVNFSAGRVRLNGFTIDNSTGSGTNKWPVLVATNGLYIQNCVLVAPAATESIHAASAFNVGLLGTSCANSNKSSNVTFSPNAGTFSVDALVR